MRLLFSNRIRVSEECCNRKDRYVLITIHRYNNRLATVTLLVFIILSPCCLCGQSLEGRVRDSRDSQPIEYITVTISSDVVSLKTATDSLGRFAFHNLKTGEKYHLTFSRVGFLKQDTVVILQSSLKLPIILLPELSDLKPVTVVSRKPLIERKIDRLLFNVENNLNVSALDAMEVLDKTPLLRVEGENISIVGKDKVGVMLDGRLLNLTGQQLTTFLKSIPVESIARIEVITNPPSRYEAVGNSGLINIVTKRVNKKGFYGVLNPTYTYAGTNSAALVLSLNYNINKLQLFSTAFAGKGSNTSKYANDIFYPDKMWKERNQQTEFMNVVSGTIGFELPVSAKSSMGMSFSHMISHPNTTTNTVTEISDLLSKPDSLLNIVTDAKKPYRNQALNLHFSHKFDSSGKKIDIDADYYRNEFDIGNTVTTNKYFGDGTSTSELPLFSWSGQTAQAYTLNAAVESPIGKWKLEYGGKLSVIENRTNAYLSEKVAGVWKNDSSKSDRFKVQEIIEAFFFSFNHSFSEKLEVQGGLRSELTQTSLFSLSLHGNFKKEYFSVFPTLYIKYSPQENHTLTINYGRRYNRPQFSSLNPFRIYSNYFTYEEGNPYLNPYFSNNVELGYSYKDYFYATLFYSRTYKGIGTLTIINDSTTIQADFPFNYLNSNQAGFSSGLTFNRVKNIQSSNEFSLYYSDTHSGLSVTKSDVAGWGADLRSVNKVFINKSKSLAAGITFTYQFPYLAGIAKDKKYYYLDCSLRYALPKKPLQFTFSVRDIFKTRNVYWTEFINNLQRNSFLNNNSRRLSFDIRYTFGETKMKRGNSHAENRAEKGRLN